MSTDPRIEEPSCLAFSRQDIRAGKASPVIRGLVDIIDSQKRRLNAIAAIDQASITTVEELDALPVGASILHDDGFQKLPAKRSADDGHWYVTGSNEFRRAETLLPARVIHRGTE